MQHQVGDEGACQVLAPGPRVQQRHVQDNDVHPLFLGDDPPLLQNLPIVAAQPVNTLCDQQIAGAQLFYETLVSGAVKVFSGLLVHINVLFGNPKLRQRNHLTLFVLLL